jgi:hypothetical protein
MDPTGDLLNIFPQFLCMFSLDKEFFSIKGHTIEYKNLATTFQESLKYQVTKCNKGVNKASNSFSLNKDLQMQEFPFYSPCFSAARLTACSAVSPEWLFGFISAFVQGLGGTLSELKI